MATLGEVFNWFPFTMCSIPSVKHPNHCQPVEIWAHQEWLPLVPHLDMPFVLVMVTYFNSINRWIRYKKMELLLWKLSLILCKHKVTQKNTVQLVGGWTILNAQGEIHKT